MHLRCQVPFRTSRQNVGFLLRRCSRKGLHLAMMGEPPRFFRFVVGFSSNDGELRMTLMLAQERPISMQVARESWGLLSSHCRANRPHLGLCPETNVPLLERQGSRGCIQDSPGESSLISSGCTELHSPLELRRVSLGAH